jgi:hypothetical protein
MHIGQFVLSWTANLSFSRDEQIQKNFASLVKEALPASATGKPIEIWFQDEARVGQKGTLEY